MRSTQCHSSSVWHYYSLLFFVSLLLKFFFGIRLASDFFCSVVWNKMMMMMSVMLTTAYCCCRDILIRQNSFSRRLAGRARHNIHNIQPRLSMFLLVIIRPLPMMPVRLVLVILQQTRHTDGR